MNKRVITVLLAVLLILCLPAAALAESGVIRTNTSGGVVNLRAQGGKHQAVIGSVKNGTSVEILYKGNYWDKVRIVKTGQIGWVYKTYVSTGGSSSSSSSYDNSYASGMVGHVSTKYSGSSVNVRYGAGTGYGVVTSVTPGTKVSILGTSGNWYQIEIPSKGLIGFISTTYVTLGLNARTTGNVNLRTGAGTDYAKITTIPKGTNISILSVGNSWTQVSYAGKTGYISNSYWTYR